MSSKPLVSALMITGKTPHHRKLADVAVRCFLEQEYPAAHRELVIINTALTGPWFPKHPSSIVKEIHLPHFTGTLGELRNISMQHASGDLLIQWDDDDWHHPNRITFQVDHHKPGTIGILQRQYRLDLTRDIWGRVDASTWPMGGIVGTMIHEPTELRYPSKAKAEDKVFIRKWKQVNQQDNPAELYVRLYHGNNTWHRGKVMNPALKPKAKSKGDAEFIGRVKGLYAA